MQKIETLNAPKAIGPYSQAVLAGDLLFVSGQLGVDPSNGNLVIGGIKPQTEQALKNLKAILIASNLNFQNVVRCEIFLKNISDFATVNDIYSQNFILAPKPARQTIEVSNLPKDALIEISCIAFVRKNENAQV